MLHTRHAVTIHVAISVVFVLMAQGGQTHTRQREEQHGLLVASMDYGFFTDGQEPTPKGDSELAKGAAPFSVVKVKPNMIWSMPVQYKSVEDQAAIKETVEWLNRLGYLELSVRSDKETAMSTFRDAVIKELTERFGVRVVAQAPPKIRFCVGWHGGEHHQTGQGEGANPGTCGAGVACTYRWSNHFPYRERRRWAHCIPTCISAHVPSMPSEW